MQPQRTNSLRSVLLLNVHSMPPKDLFDKGNDVQMMLGNGALADEFREAFQSMFILGNSPGRSHN